MENKHEDDQGINAAGIFMYYLVVHPMLIAKSCHQDEQQEWKRRVMASQANLTL